MTDLKAPRTVLVAFLLAAAVGVALAGAGVILLRVLEPEIADSPNPDSRSLLIGQLALVLTATWAAVMALVLTSGGLVSRRFRKRIDVALNAAMFDSLTDLPNRAQFVARLSDALANAGRHKHYVGVIVVDLDGFKSVNDTGGHAAGDRLLQRVSERIVEQTRHGEIAARLGGDEFGIIVPIVDGRVEVDALAGRLAERLRMIVDFGEGGRTEVTASIGVAIYPFDATDASSLMATADAKMYQTKVQRSSR